MQPATAAEIAGALTPKDGVDTVWAGDGVVYTTRLIAKASQSRLAKIVGTPIYASLTIRNWNTTRKLAELSAA